MKPTRKSSRMFCARWDSGTGYGPRLQPLTLGFFQSTTVERATKMGGPAHAGYEIVPVTITIRERRA